MTVLPLAGYLTPHADDSMGQAKSRFVDVLCPGPPGSRDSRSSADDSFDGFVYQEDDDVELAASCCRISGGLRGGYSSAASDEVALTDTPMVVLRDRQTPGEVGRSTRLVTIAPRLHVEHAPVDSDCGDSEVLFSREIQIMRHQCGHHRVR